MFRAQRKSNSNSKFQKGSGMYKCESCGKQTRATGRNDCEHVRMCSHCYEVGGWVNAVSDGECTIAGVPEEYRADVAKDLGIVLEETKNA